ncbi:MAG: hypothetical protein NT133_26930 [Alphaproteobacteria bacterium]|nr:hypothetical protein [Alphaproteobacteria bacterium]
MTILARLRAAPFIACPPTARYHLDPVLWRDVAAAAELVPLALWADGGNVVALLRGAAPILCSVAVEQGFYPALSPFHPTAAPFERMVRDLWGYVAVGGTDPRPLLDFGHWPVTAPLGRPAAPFGTQEPPDSGRAHRGILALLRGKSPRAAARFAARAAGEATVAQAIAFARAAEAASGGIIPSRAEGLRDLMAGLEHLAGGLARLAAIATAAEAGLLAAACARHREAVARAAGVAFGHRLMMDAVVPGGVAADIEVPGPDALIRLARDLPRRDLADLAYASLATRLAALPDVAAACDAALSEILTQAEMIVPRLDVLMPGPTQFALDPATGEALGTAEGPDGAIRHWLRLEDGQIAGAFLCDPGWLRRPAAEAAMARAAPADRALIAAALGTAAAGMEL